MEYLWQKISMDFIIKLLKLKDIIIEIKYNSILVIINELIKYTYFILCIKIFETRQTV